jgi:hypothetical protein
MTEIIKRKQHCSFCEDEGHTINNCQDPQIDFLVKQFTECISVDIKCNFKMKYIKYIISLYNISEIRILGYQCGICMSKQSKEEFVSELLHDYYNPRDNKYSDIFNSMLQPELTYFAESIASTSTSWNKRKISVKRAERLLSISNDKSRLSPYETNDMSVVSIMPRAIHDDSNIEIDKDVHIEYYLLPLVTDEILFEFSPIVKKGIQYIYYLSIGVFLLNLYVIHNTL